MKYLIKKIIIFLILVASTLKVYSQNIITDSQLKQIVQDRVELDSLRHRITLIKTNFQSLELAKIQIEKAFFECQKQTEKAAEISAAKTQIIKNNNKSLKGWKRRLIWQKTKTPILAVITFFIGTKI